MTKPRPPRDGRCFADPAAEPVYRGIKALDRASQHELLRRLQVELLAEDVSASATQAAREARALTALNDASAELGHSPSVREYRQLATKHRDEDWPDVRCVRRWLGAGSWNDALRRAHLEPLPDGDVIVFQHGPHYLLEEVVLALRDCAEELGEVPTFPQYMAWARRPDVRERAGRRPRSAWVFTRLCGGYSDALRAAGLVSGDPAHGRMTLIGLRRSEYRIGDETLRQALLEVAGRLGRSPRVQEYLAERIRIYEETLAAGAPRALPSYGTFNRRFGSDWDSMLIWAGLEPLGGRATSSHPRTPRAAAGPRVTREMICAALQEAWREEGDPFTIHAYMAWRAEKLATMPRWERHRYPSYHTIWARYRTWEAACAAAIAPDDADDR